MPLRQAHMLHRPSLSTRVRVVAALSALVALLAAGAFFLSVSHAPPPNGAVAPPNARIVCGASLWCLFDASLQDRFARPFPHFAIDFVESRTALDLPAKPHGHEILLMLPAEQFLAAEIVRRHPNDPQATFTLGPEVCQTHLALMMSAKTRDALTLSGTRSLPTLGSWLEACQSTASGQHPVRFVMASPATCSSSWLGLADLLMEHLQTDNLANVPRGELAGAEADLKREISVEGVSDRVEMYRFLMGNCPDDHVLLVYGHLAELIPSNTFGNFTVVTPQLHFQPVVRAIIETKRSDHLSAESYAPTLLEAFSHALLPDMIPSATTAQPQSALDYTTMSEVLDLWTDETR